MLLFESDIVFPECVYKVRSSGRRDQKFPSRVRWIDRACKRLETAAQDPVWLLSVSARLANCRPEYCHRDAARWADSRHSATACVISSASAEPYSRTGGLLCA